MTGDAWVAAIAKIVLVIGVAGCVTLLLRLIRWPGGRPCASLWGATLAGLLLGPGVFGGLAPAAYERAMLGGQVERERLQTLDAEHVTQREALSSSGVSEVAIAELDAEHAARRQPMAEALDRAVSAERAAWAQLAATVAALMAVLGGVSIGPDRRVAGERGGTGSVVAGVLAGLVAGLTIAAGLVWLTAASRGLALAAGGAIAAGSVVAGVPMRWVARPGRERPAMTLLAANLAIAAAMVVAGLTIEGGGAAAAAWGIVLPGLYAVGVGVGRGLSIGAARRLRRFARFAVLWIAVPSLAGSLAAWIDPGLLIGWGLALLLVMAISAGDLHMLGAWLGWKAGGSPSERTSMALRSLEALGRGAAITQCAWGVVLVASGVCDPTTPAGAMVLALILVGALAFELALDWARPAARMMDDGGWLRLDG